MKVEIDPASAAKQRWLLPATVFIFLGYAWLTARSTEPKIALPAVVAKAEWVENGASRPLRHFGEQGPSHFYEWTLLRAEARRLPAELRMLGKFHAPLELIINADSPQAYSVSDERIELGLGIAARKGELGKAFAKAWLYQVADGSIQRSMLKMEVAADVLAALGDGEANESFAEVGNWLKFVKSFATSCHSSWNPSELSDKLCGESTAVNPFAFRPLLDGMLMAKFNSLAPWKRQEVAAAWARSLREPRADDGAPPPNSLIEWRHWLRNEVVALFPGFKAEDLAAQIDRAELGPDAKLKVDLAIKATDSGEAWSAKELQDEDVLAAVANPDGSYRLQPGGVELSSFDRLALSTEYMAWAGHRSPTLGEILTESIAARRVLFVAGSRGVHLKSLSQGGPELFARDNRNISFVVFELNSLALAAKKQLVSPEETVAAFMSEDQRQRSPLLGLSFAKWERGPRAYRVLGAIEAVEWFRSPVAMQAAAPVEGARM